MSENNQRFICTKEDPWTPEKGGMAVHPDATEVGCDDYNDGSVITYECPHCGKRFKEEIG